MLTVIGVGTTSVALVSLVVLTQLMGKIVTALTPTPAVAAPSDSATLIQKAAAPVEGALGPDPTLVAAVAAAVAVAEEEYTAVLADPASGGSRRVSGWKGLGRWQTMTSRLGINPRRGNRRGR